jgi:50S ribosomal protein L16 3-hydroxylase
VTLLERLLHPVSLSEFYGQYLFKEPFAQPCSGSKYRGLLSWEMLYGIVERHNNCWLPRQGRLPHEIQNTPGKLKFSAAVEAYKEGRTILVRHAESANSQIQNIAEDFEKHFGAPIDVQLYYTPEGQQGFDWHYDLEDVFIIQSVGSKEFHLKRNTVSSFPFDVKAMKDHFFREPPSKEIHCSLEAGDFLYIPAGWWHRARATTDSAHLSIGVLTSSPLLKEMSLETDFPSKMI